jgi:hypothetical protein
MAEPEFDCPCPTHSPDRDRSGPVQYGRNEAGYITTTRLTNGQRMCPICMEYHWPCELTADPEGQLLDMCRSCADKEEAALLLADVLGLIVENDQAYAERYPLLFEAADLALRAGFDAGVRIDTAESHWPVVYIELPDGQVSWHMPEHQREWVGHSTPEKFERIRRYRARITPGLE